MAMSIEQKAKNSAAKLVKQKAYTQRKKLFESMLKAVETDPDVIAARKEMDFAGDCAEEASDVRKQKIEQLQLKIEELEKQINEIREQWASCINLNAARSASEKWRKLTDEKISNVKAEFPDMSGNARWSVASWVPPQNVKNAMDDAKKNVCLIGITNIKNNNV